MKNTELRIGNWVYCNDCSDVAMEKQVDLISEKRSYAHDWLVSSPIPLTEEWLVKFGFTEELDDSFRIYSSFNLSIELLRIEFEYLVYFESTRINEIKYVHQIQNLYFALTGEELEILKH
jgi:hypothetical protein